MVGSILRNWAIQLYTFSPSEKPFPPPPFHFYLLIFVVQCDAQGILIPWPEFKLAPLQWKVDS